jgi:hypothetical protein
LARLIVELGPRRWEIALEGEVLRAGSGPACALVLADAAVGREHAEFKRTGASWRVLDLESATGTKVNGAFVHQAVLADGDRLEMGGARLQFRAGGAAAPEPAPIPAAGVAAPPAPVPAPIPTPVLAVTPAPLAPAAPVGFAPAPRSPGRRAPTASRSRSSGGSQATTLFAMGAVGLVGIGAFLFLSTSGRLHPNNALAGRMESLLSAMKYEEIVALEKQIDPNERLYGDLAREKVRIAKGALAEKRRAALEVQAIQFMEWRIRKFQQENRRDTDGLIRLYDEYLESFPGTTNWGPIADKRLKLAGAPSPAVLRPRPAPGEPGDTGVDAPPAVAPIVTAGTLLHAAGEEADAHAERERFGDAMAVYDRFLARAGETISGADLEAFRSQCEKRKAKLVKAAEKAFEQMEQRAFVLSEGGSIGEAEALYKRACEIYGIDELVDRAKFQLDQLRQRRR